MHVLSPAALGLVAEGQVAGQFVGVEVLPAFRQEFVGARFFSRALWPWRGYRFRDFFRSSA